MAYNKRYSKESQKSFVQRKKKKGSARKKANKAAKKRG